MGLIDQPSRWEAAPWMNHSNPPDAIDYSRPREGFYMSTTPLDIQNAKDVQDGWLGDAWEAIKGVFTDEEPEKLPTEEPEKDEPPKPEEKKEETKKPDAKSSLVLAYQSFFSKSHPLIGKLYSGPKDGKLNQEIQSAAQAAEAQIAAAIGDDGVKGMIWSGKGFGTSPADVGSALSVIVKHQGKKSSLLNRKERILALSSFIDE